MVSRDYKRSKARREPFSGWTGLVIGLAVGLGVGLALYFFDPRTPPDTAGAPAADAEPASAREAAAGDPERYDFYEVLPNFEVIVPEREAVLKLEAPTAPVERAGSYVLQVGSYRKFEEADRVRAQLALQGIESRVQPVSIDNDTMHRVRVGPINDLKELNRVRDRLREAEMDFLVIRAVD
ncbi:MAG: SPOR domain-containing protein [Steroidobacteraceae bacterium]